MKKKITFWCLLGNWFWLSIVLRLINSYTLQIPILDNIIMAGLGITLLLYPVYPTDLENKYTPKQCRLFIRIAALVEILLSFAIRTNFQNDEKYATVYSADVISTYSYRPEAVLKFWACIAVIIVVIIGVVVWRKNRKQ